MTLDARVLNGLSPFSARFNLDAVQDRQNFTDTSNPAEKYDRYRAGNAGVQFYKYPLEMPKYKTIIVARDYGSQASLTLGANSRAVEGYVLPIPSESPITDTYQVGYDDNFSLLAAMASAAGIGENTQRVARYFGFNLNRQKSVLLEAPLLKRHELRWKLAPKSQAESRQLKQLLDKLKLGMMPPVLENTFGALIGFPYVYEIFFSPNSEFLYPFKPCVLESMSVNYTGGGQTTSFFRGGAPESVIVSLNFLELEFWVRQDWQKWIDSSDPVNTLSTESALRTTTNLTPSTFANTAPNINSGAGSTVTGLPGLEE